MVAYPVSRVLTRSTNNKKRPPQAKKPFKLFENLGADDGTSTSKHCGVHLVGDALLAPFWPQGTGANRAVLSALDTAYFISQLWAKGSEGGAVAPRLRAHELMSRAEAKDVKSGGGLDPNSRYTNF